MQQITSDELAELLTQLELSTEESRDELLTDLPQVLGEAFGWSTDWSVSSAAVGVVIVAIAAWDAVESVLKARRSAKGTRVA